MTPAVTTAARRLLLFYLFALPLMQPPIPILGFLAAPADLLVLPLAGLVALLLLARRLPLAIDPAFAFIAAYFGAMALSALFSGDPPAALPKLATQLYLLSLPLLIVLLVTDREMLRRACLWWLGGSAFTALIGLLSLLLFALEPDHPLLEFTLNQFGTLPPGDYPRLSLTLLNANLACNYLSVSLLILLAVRQARWIGRTSFTWLLGAILLAAAFTLSPGLGGVALAIGLWLWLSLRPDRPFFSRAALIGGIVVALLSLVVASVTPIIHPTAPFLITLPSTDLVLAPSVRLMIWLDAIRNFVDAPWTGRGIGAEAVNLDYMTPSGGLHHMTDAHNMFLHIAVQCGLVGLAALLLLLVHLARRSGPWRLADDPVGILRLGLGLSLAVGLVFQSLTGSFEDARHLWAALGLLLAASRIEKALP